MNFVHHIDDIVKGLNAGQTILYPTATLWGIGCKASCCDSLTLIDSAKSRVEGKTYITLISDLEMVSQFVDQVPVELPNILDRYREPVTFIIDGAVQKYKHLSLDRAIALRITPSRLCQQIIRHLDDGLVSTSANVSGTSSPTDFSDIAPQIMSAVDMIYPPERAGRLTGKASTILKIHRDGNVSVIR